MANLPLTIACGPYDRMEGIRSGAVAIEGIDATTIAIESPPAMFTRMIQGNEFDVSEMSLTTFMSARSRGEFPFVGIPVFPSRVFRHGFIYVNTRAGIAKPRDLEGRRIGVQGYRQTAAVWIRGMLRDDFGVDFSGVRWVDGGGSQAGRPIPGLQLEQAAGAGALSEMLARAEIDALVAAGRPPALGKSPEVARLFPNYRQVEREYYLRTGIFPIMHTMVIREGLYRDEPWIAASLFKAFEASKRLALGSLRFSGALRIMLPWLYDDIDEIDRLFGGDPFPSGLEPNRSALQTLARYLLEERMVDRPIDIDAIFLPMAAAR
ncbi:MAG: ABC transporter substrate-binding protein [Betaproteobacteria bacterium]|nr:ABC transporter substrate-binding protein [Betaproteobacteria bacterium]